MLRIKEILEENGLSASALHRLMAKKGYQLSDISIRNIINEKHSPKVETLMEIADTLNIDVRDLFVPSLHPEMKGRAIYIKDDDGHFKKIGELNI